MNQNKILDSVLRALADLYEAGNRSWQPIEPESATEYEPLRECMAQLRAEGSVIQPAPSVNLYELTPKGYSIYQARIAALRALG